VTIRVLFFGRARDITGVPEERVELQNDLQLEALRREYEARFPRLAEMGSALLMAVNEEFRGRGWLLADGDEVAFIPPVSGGDDPASPDFFRLTRERIPTAQLADRMKAAQDGAVVVFEGIVRNHSGGRTTLYLEYEAYEPMAVGKMEEIGREAHAQYGIDRVGIIHRLGRIEIGETSVAIVVTAAHRGAAFDACRFLIDRLKQTVPIWKKEFFEDGPVWAEGEKPTPATT
jgi:MoaE-MoaD fusion protein